MSLKRAQPVDPTEYAHLSELDRMNNGYPYIPWDDELSRSRSKARELIKEFNQSESPSDEQKLIMGKLFNKNCDLENVIIEPNLRVDYGFNITFGKNFVMNFDCVILDCAPVTFGDDCMIAPGVHIYAATHPLEPIHRRQGDNYYELAFPVKIGNNVWIGGKSIILPGVVIGDNSIIGAGSVVSRDVPPNVVVAGNPARVLRTLDEQ